MELARERQVYTLGCVLFSNTARKCPRTQSVLFRFECLEFGVVGEEDRRRSCMDEYLTNVEDKRYLDF
jgi:hypothetical protein